MQIGVGISLTGGQQRAGFNPATLFTGGLLGVWWDPSDLSSMFQDSAGTTPAAVDSPVGKINDKSGNGYHLTQATSGARPTLRRSAGGLYYLEFDGVDDAITATTGNITNLFRNIGAGSMFVAATVSSVVEAQPLLLAWNTNGATTRAGFLPNSATLQAGGRRLNGDAFSAATGGVLVADTPFIATGLFSWSTATVTLRKDRVQVAQNTSFSNAGLTEDTASSVAGFSQGAPSFAGRIYGAIALQRLPTALEQTNVESYLGAKCGV